ncbi:MAG: nitroreductase family protein [Desulfovibrionaceae bacterium]|nr:nitroreductase family protein [Desulfovibrionaceae bacterium]
MNLNELLTTSRTCRRFQTGASLSETTLARLVDLARISPSARNAQVLRYAIVTDAAARRQMFGLITLGGALKQRPTEEQAPGGYIVILAPEELNAFGLMDVGIAAQSINLAANDMDLACCMIGAFNNPGVRALLAPPADLDPKLVLALGAPAEKRGLAPLNADGSTTYFLDDEGVHRVPKRPLDEVLIIRR